MLRKEKDVTETKRRVTENGKTQKLLLAINDSYDDL
jgi:hypothetical protein